MARPLKAKAIERLRKVLNEKPESRNLPYYDSPTFTKWRISARTAITSAFGDESTQIKDFNNVRYSRDFPKSYSERQDAYVSGIKKAGAILEEMIAEIEEYWEEDEESPNTSDTRLKTAKDTTKVFVIHGHDEAAREAVASFLKKLKLEPIILHKQANRGRTIIEKFEDYSDVGFAVVLLTPDDVGAPRNKKQSKPKFRARQNVIFELGFFIGKLGRHRVCILNKDDVEIPSDYQGVAYTDFDDAGAWQMKVFQELKAAGFKVDANRLV